MNLRSVLFKSEPPALQEEESSSQSKSKYEMEMNVVYAEEYPQASVVRAV